MIGSLKRYGAIFSRFWRVSCWACRFFESFFDIFIGIGVTGAIRGNFRLNFFFRQKRGWCFFDRYFFVGDRDQGQFLRESNRCKLFHSRFVRTGILPLIYHGVFKFKGMGKRILRPILFDHLLRKCFWFFENCRLKGVIKSCYF